MLAGGEKRRSRRGSFIAPERIDTSILSVVVLCLILATTICIKYTLISTYTAAVEAEQVLVATSNNLSVARADNGNGEAVSMNALADKKENRNDSS